jgi:cyclopropane fatty-acyl-phospholipid synthase-like methyltransferase
MSKGFDWVAPVYTQLENLAHGDALTVARLAFIEVVFKAPRVLLVGEGNGRFLSACLANKTAGSITVIDSSARMLQHLQRRVRQIQIETRLELVHADFFRWDDALVPFDAVVTHFFLDLFRPSTQQQFVKKLSELTHSESDWVDVDGIHIRHSTRSQRWVECLNYGFDRLFSGVEADRYYDPLPIIREGGWAIRREKNFLKGAVRARSLCRTDRFFCPEGTRGPRTP